MNKFICLCIAMCFMGCNTPEGSVVSFEKAARELISSASIVPAGEIVGVRFYLGTRDTKSTIASLVQSFQDANDFDLLAVTVLDVPVGEWESEIDPDAAERHVMLHLHFKKSDVEGIDVKTDNVLELASRFDVDPSFAKTLKWHFKSA
jgi:hypothetical protein